MFATKYLWRFPVGVNPCQVSKQTFPLRLCLRTGKRRVPLLSPTTHDEPEVFAKDTGIVISWLPDDGRKKSWNYRGVWGPVCRSIKDHLLRVWYGKTVGPSLGHSVYLLSISVAFCLSGRPQQAKTTQISTLLSNNLPTSFNYSFDMSELHEFWRMTHFPPKGHEDRWADSIVQLSVICKQRQHRARNPGKTVYFRCNNVSN